jgi:hypothetical protein
MSGDPSPEQTSALDRPAARVVAGLVFLGAVGLLGWLHRDDFFPPEAPPVAADDPVALCLAQRSADIAQMEKDEVITADQAKLFASRAEAFCQAQFGGGSGPPPPPQ